MLELTTVEVSLKIIWKNNEKWPFCNLCTFFSVLKIASDLVNRECQQILFNQSRKHRQPWFLEYEDLFSQGILHYLKIPIQTITKYFFQVRAIHKLKQALVTIFKSLSSFQYNCNSTEIRDRLKIRCKRWWPNVPLACRQ